MRFTFLVLSGKYLVGIKHLNIKFYKDTQMPLKIICQCFSDPLNLWTSFNSTSVKYFATSQFNYWCHNLIQDQNNLGLKKKKEKTITRKAFRFLLYCAKLLSFAHWAANETWKSMLHVYFSDFSRLFCKLFIKYMNFKVFFQCEFFPSNAFYCPLVRVNYTLLSCN